MKEVEVKKPSKASSFYKPELDAIRFFLFAGVFFHHAFDGSANETYAKSALAIGTILQSLQNMTGFCLSFFFFLSSYLITRLLQIEKERTGTLDLPRFYLRRMLRLWPLYVTYLLIAAFYSVLSTGHLHRPGLLGAMLLFTGNWYLIVNGSAFSILFFHLWSISVEEQFYVVFPFIARRFSAAQVKCGCVILCVAALSCSGTLAALHFTVHQVWLNSLVESLFFASGVFYGLQTSRSAEQKKSARGALSGIGAGLLFWALGASTNIIEPTYHLQAWQTVFGYAAGDVGCAFILWGTLQVPASWLSRPIVYLGRVAYGLYVFHMLILTLVHQFIPRHLLPMGFSLLIAFGLTIVVGILSYEFFEKPFLRLKHRFELVHSRTA